MVVVPSGVTARSHGVARGRSHVVAEAEAMLWLRPKPRISQVAPKLTHIDDTQITDISPRRRKRRTLTNVSPPANAATTIVVSMAAKSKP
ncbi:hypothetical protein L6452_09157 [Arctium lappa]|uniref:Uncharacterized protein n=1 Tax=Arctium lappa TaxID=4217 RepID=A0ACB9DK32_ARCLA|nr:hypothetical protein L6452_09157 [Arctium lappa]